MGQLIRNTDWTNTALGDPDQWPQSLRTMVSVMLDNPFGMYIAWGDDYTQLYNDGYRPILGTSKHPDALGNTTRNTFSEIWDIIGPMFDGVMEGKAVRFPDFMLPLHRNGYTEECYFDFSYSPIRKEDGEVGGVLVTVIETTGRKKIEDDLRESNNQLAFAIDATELGTFDLNPLTGKFAGNNRLKEWFGLPDETELELKHALDAIADKDRPAVVKAINKALEHSSGGHYDIIYSIVHPVTKKETIVRAKGRAWFNEKKIAWRFNGTLQDVTQQQVNLAAAETARKITHEKERDLRLMITQAPIAISIARGPNHVIEVANTKALEMWGRKEEDVLNKPALEAMPEFAEQGFKTILDQVYNTGKHFSASELPVKVVRPHGFETIYINFSFDPLFDINGNINGIMAIGLDVTEQATARHEIVESKQRFQAAVSAIDGIVWTNTASGKMTGAQPGWSTLTGQDECHYKNYGWADAVHPEDAAGTIEAWENAVKNKTSFVYQHRVKKKDGHYGHFSVRAIPMFDAEGNITEWVGVHTDITKDRLAEEEKLSIFKKMEESEERFRNSVKQAPLGIAVFRLPDYTTELANETYLHLIEQPEDKIIGRPLFDTLPDARETVEPLFRQVAETGKSFQATELPVIVNKYGIKEPSYFNIVYHPLKENDGSISAIMIVATEVTESVNAKQLLEKRELHFRNMVMESPVPMTILRGKDLVIEMANSMMLDSIWQKTEVEVTGRKLMDVFPELENQKYPELLRQVIVTGKKYKEAESATYVKHGDTLTKFYLDLEYAPLREGNESISGVIITINDVTSKVAARKKVEEAEERIRLATEAAELATWELDLRTKDIIYSPSLATIFGHEEDKKITLAEMRNQLHPDDSALLVKKAYQDALKTGLYKYEAKVVKTDGSVCWIRTQGKVYFDEKNNPYRMIGTLRDISDEKQYQLVLEESEHKFRLLANSMPQIVWTTDASGATTYLNEAMQRFSGKTLDELMETSWLEIIHPDDKERNLEVWQESIAKGEDYFFEHRFKKSTGEYHWHLSRAVPQKDAAGNIQMWVGASTDIQEMKELDQQKDFFIGMASHELKTPITSIKGYVQILQMMYSDNEDSFLQKSLKTVEKQVATLTNLITDLLDLSKIKSGTLLLDKKSFVLNEVVEEVVSEMAIVSPVCKIVYEISHPIIVQADRDRIAQVLINFLTNAIKYSPDACEIIVRCEHRDNEVLVWVRDFGIGISARNQQKIFERFYRVEGKDEKTYPGFDIGLFIASEIIQRHNGKIGVDSEPGKGAEFFFSLPANS